MNENQSQNKFADGAKYTIHFEKNWRGTWSEMEQASLSTGTVVQSGSLVTLPVEILVCIAAFLSIREKITIRCVSKTLRSVSEVASLWEDFTWSRYASRDEKLLEHVLRMFGKHVKRIHFADHITPPKLEVMLKFCKNVVHLSLPSFQSYIGTLRNWRR